MTFIWFLVIEQGQIVVALFMTSGFHSNTGVAFALSYHLGGGGWRIWEDQILVFRENREEIRRLQKYARGKLYKIDFRIKGIII